MPPAKPSLDNLPLLVYRSWWRTLLAFLVVWMPSLLMGWYVVFIWHWRPLGPSWLVNLTVMAFLASILISSMISIVAGRVFRHQGAAYRFLAQQKDQEALAELEKHLAFVERNPLLDHWRTALFLYVQKYSLRELAWINIGFIHTHNGDMEKRRAAYEQCLAINPHNEMAIDNLNLTAAFAGEPLRLGGSGLTFVNAVDLKLAQRQANIRLVAILVLAFGPVPAVSCLATMLMQDLWNSVMPLIPDRQWYVTTIIIVLALLFLSRMLMNLYHLAATRMVLFDLYRANRLAKAGRHHEAIKALEVQRAFFDEHPWVDTLRWVLMFSPTTYPYREWVLISLADIYLDLGHTDQYIHYNMECLLQNPANAFARSRLEFCNTILGSLNRPLLSMPARPAGGA